MWRATRFEGNILGIRVLGCGELIDFRYDFGEIIYFRFAYRD